MSVSETQREVLYGEGIKFDGWAVAPPTGEWSYALDDSGISYGGKPGTWPFYGLNPLGTRKPRTPRTIRLAPDSAYQAWRNEYVLAGLRPDGTVWAAFSVFVARQGAGGYVADASATISLSGEIAVQAPARVLPEAERKARLILAFLRRAMDERDHGRRLPHTAYEAWIAAKHAG